MSTEQEQQGTSTRPYLIRALHDWCTDNGFTPYLAVYVDRSVLVPQEYVKNSEIVLNVSFDATSQLQLGNEFIEFKARFGGVARDIVVPVDHVIAIYARENGQGMAFPVPNVLGSDGVATDAGDGDTPEGGARGASVSPLRLTPATRTPRERSGIKAVKTEVNDAAPVADDNDATPASSNDHDDPPPGAPDGNGGGVRPTLRRIK
jgi:stringent starvation protein B